jgi:hypothetical protein
MKTADSPNVFKKHPLAFACFGLAVAFGAAAFYRSSETPAREALLDQKSAEGQRLQNNITNATTLQDQHDAFVALNRKLSERLVNPAQLGENLQFFYRIEAATNTKIIDLRQTYSTAAAKTAKGKFVSVPYSVSLQGELRSVLNFVRKIEKSPRFAKVTSATLLQAQAQSDNAHQQPITLNLSLEMLGTP